MWKVYVLVCKKKTKRKDAEIRTIRNQEIVCENSERPHSLFHPFCHSTGIFVVVLTWLQGLTLTGAER